jgi:hypothetical protein
VSHMANTERNASLFRISALRLFVSPPPQNGNMMYIANHLHLNSRLPIYQYIERSACTRLPIAPANITINSNRASHQSRVVPQKNVTSSWLGHMDFGS